MSINTNDNLIVYGWLWQVHNSSGNPRRWRTLESIYCRNPLPAEKSPHFYNPPAMAV